VLDFQERSSEELLYSATEAILWGIPLEVISDDRGFRSSDIRKGEQVLLIPANDRLRWRLRKKIADKKEPLAKITIEGVRLLPMADEQFVDPQTVAYFFLTDFQTTW
jgi:hypothetical protein